MNTISLIVFTDRISYGQYVADQFNQLRPTCGTLCRQSPVIPRRLAYAGTATARYLIARCGVLSQTTFRVTTPRTLNDQTCNCMLSLILNILRNCSRLNVLSWLLRNSCNAVADNFYSAPQCSHCKRCTSYGNSVRLSVRLSVTRRYCVKTTARSTV